MASSCMLSTPHLIPYAALSVQRTTTFCASRSTEAKLNPSCRTLIASCASSSLPFDLPPPPIDLDFIGTVTAEGAAVSNDGIIESFHNDIKALEAFYNGAVVADLSHCGRIRVSGEDRIHFLHNQSTANFESVQAEQGFNTVFVTPTARTIDIAQAWIMKNSVLLFVSMETCQSVVQMLNKYIFFADKVEIEDITKKTSLFMLSGLQCDQVLTGLNLGDVVGQPCGTHRHYSVNGMPVTVGAGSYISDDGYTLMASAAAAGSVWKALLEQGAIPMGSMALERLRIMQGKPAPGKELKDEFNVLEAGLWNSISVNKGCYKGQETISRLITYDGVKQRLLGVNLSSQAEPGTIIFKDGKKVGKLTSYACGIKPSDHFGLCYIKRQNATPGASVLVGENVSGTLMVPPYLSTQRPPSLVKTMSR